MEEDVDLSAIRRCATLGAFVSMGKISPTRTGFQIDFINREIAEKFRELKDDLFETPEQRTRLLRRAVENFFAEKKGDEQDHEPSIEEPPAQGGLKRIFKALFGAGSKDQDYLSEETRNW